jgi:hypothetical protein
MDTKKQMSVEWLSNQAYVLFEQYSEGRFDRITLNKLMVEATDDAKEMHKEEIAEAYWNGSDGIEDKTSMLKMGEQYYNETYGGGEQ